MVYEILRSVHKVYELTSNLLKQTDYALETICEIYIH